MRKALISLVAVAMLAVPSTSLAAGNAHSGPTLGDAISDGLYGNEPNMADGTAGGPAEQAPGTKGGNVLPTQSPGPWVNNKVDPDNPTRGMSVGQINHTYDVNFAQLVRASLGG